MSDKKCYTVERGTYSDYQVLAVYTTQEQAEQALALFNLDSWDECEVVERPLDQLPVKTTWWEAKLRLVHNYRDNLIIVGYGEPELEERHDVRHVMQPAVRPLRHSIHEGWGDEGPLLTVSGANKDEVLKVLGEQKPALAERAEAYIERITEILDMQRRRRAEDRDPKIQLLVYGLNEWMDEEGIPNVEG